MCGLEDLGAPNFTMKPFVLRGPRLHTDWHCAQVESFELRADGTLADAVEWTNPPSD